MLEVSLDLFHCFNEVGRIENCIRLILVSIRIFPRVAISNDHINAFISLVYTLPSAQMKWILHLVNGTHVGMAGSTHRVLR